MRQFAAIILLFGFLFFLLSGCGAAAMTQNTETWTFTDSAGREVEIPVTIDSVAPSGSYAQVMLYTLCPEKLLGLSTAFTRKQKQYIDEKYWDLPVFGQFYGGSGTINYEEIIAAVPDIIIDVGEAKNGIAADMDGIQEQTDIPVIFIEASLHTMADAYDTLGRVLGTTEHAEELSAYVREVLSLAQENSAKLSDEDRVTVLYSQGEYGLNVNGAGSVHAEVLDTVGAVNAADISNVSDKGGDEVSIEQVLLWQPEVVILAPDSNYDEIFSDPTWADVNAVKNGSVYEVPIGPYSWLDRPPSVQRILGILWLGNLIYPELYNYDMTDKTQEFYSLFFHYALTDSEARELMANSTYR